MHVEFGERALSLDYEVMPWSSVMICMELYSFVIVGVIT